VETPLAYSVVTGNVTPGKRARQVDWATDVFGLRLCHPLTGL
jgi:hypothetical protein